MRFAEEDSHVDQALPLLRSVDPVGYVEVLRLLVCRGWAKCSDLEANQLRTGLRARAAEINIRVASLG